MSEEQIDEPQIRLSINLAALQGKFFVQLQRLLDILAVSLAGLERVDDSAYAGFSPFFTLAPAQNERLTRLSAVTEAQRWYLCTSVRDAIEFTNAFLDECWLVCSFFSLSAQGTIMGADYNRIVGVEAQKFHRLGMPDKLKRLREDFSVTSELETHLLSINTARACLVHRLGVVADRDADANGELAILWRSLELVAQSPDGTQEIVLEESGVIVEPGWQVIARVADKKKLFQKGDRIQLSYREITHTFSSMMSFATSLVQSIERYGKQIGAKMPNPKAEGA